MANFKRNLSTVLFYAAAVLSTAMMVISLPSLKSETEVGITLEQISPAVSEKTLYAGDELSLPFTCDSVSVDRWMVHLTATANPQNIGSIRLRIDGAGEKTLRTGIFNKISGTYSIPLYDNTIFNRSGKIILHITLTGGNERDPLLYLAEKAKGDAVAYQVSLQPEKGHPIVLPKNTVYPRSLLEYKQSGACVLIMNQ